MPFRIIHDFVGPFPKGRVVSLDELKHVGADVPRLTNLGAIEQDKEAKVTDSPLPPGPHNRTGDPANDIGKGTRAGTVDSTDTGTNTEPDTGNGTDNYDAMKKEDLLELAGTRGVPGVTNVMKKNDIIEAIRQHDAEPGSNAAGQETGGGQ